jgi:hypothetical protein
MALRRDLSVRAGGASEDIVLYLVKTNSST